MAVMPPVDDYSGMMEEITSWEGGQARFLAHWLMQHLGLKPAPGSTPSVIDWGCASGVYLIPFREAGWSVLGVDASPGAGALLMPWEFDRIDLRGELALPYFFSLAYCIEVAEHLQPEFAERLVEYVSYSSDVIFWSAARPGQGGTHHYNEQPKEYWLEKFSSKGFRLHPLDGELQEAIRSDPDCTRVQWLLNNSFLLQRPAPLGMLHQIGVQLAFPE